MRQWKKKKFIKNLTFFGISSFNENVINKR